jgi:xanthine dehydrogenase accessory factor
MSEVPAPGSGASGAPGAPDIWEEIVACRRRGEAAALATIVSTVGSTPGKDPMKMLVRGDGTFIGSVGGGCLEAEVWEHARSVMGTLRPMTVSFTLTEKDYPDSGLICGGTLTIFIEPVTQPALHVFGAGHVGLATARLAEQVGFRVHLYDDRPDMLDATRVGPGIEAVAGDFEETASRALAGDMGFVIVVTRGHHDDERVLRCLARGAAAGSAAGRGSAGPRSPGPRYLGPRFLGMIGSRAKRTVLLRRLAQEGVSEGWLEQVVSPVGLAIGARTAPEIAVAIVAQLIERCRGGGMGGEADRRVAQDRAAQDRAAPAAGPRAGSRGGRRPS